MNVVGTLHGERSLMSGQHLVNRLRPRARGPYRAPVAAMALATALTVAGCGGDSGKKVTLPSSSANASGSAAPTAPASPATPEQAVRTAYTDSYKAARGAVDKPPEQVRGFLSRYYTGRYLDLVVQSVLRSQQQQLVPWGSGVVVHVKKLTIDGDKATLDDCQDASNAGLKSRKTGKVVPGTVGTDAQRVVAELTRGGDGQWRLTDAKKYPKRCSRS